MAGIDASIITGGLKQPEFDPLKTMGGIMALKNAQLENQLVGMNLAGQQGMGRLVGAHTDPTTGEVDWGAVQADAANDPTTARLAPQLQEAHTQQIMQRRQALGLSENALGLIHNAAISIANGGKYDKDTISGVVNNLAKLPGMDSPEASKALAGFTTTLGDDPVANRNAVYGAALLGDPSQGGQTAAYMALHKGMTPSEANSQVAVPTQQPGGNWVPMQRRMEDVVGQEQGGPGIQTGPGTTAEGVPLADAGNPVANVTTPEGTPGFIAKGGAAHAAAVGAAPPVTISGAAPGVAEAKTAQAQQGVGFETALNSAATRYAQTRAALHNFSTDLSNFTPGPKADLTRSLGALATQFGVAPPGMARGVAAQEAAGKAAQQVLQQQFQMLGGSGSNQQFESVMHTTPSELMTKMGARKVTSMLQGNNDAIRAQQAAYQVWRKAHGPDEYGTFLQQWNQHADLRAFQAPYMSAEDMRDMRSQMKPGERAKFDAFTGFIKKQGWYNGGE